MKFSEYQEAIFNFVETGRGSAVVIAVAGSGKTTTIVEAAKRVPAGSSCTFVAFNKSIATELGERLPASVATKTLNGLGFAAWNKHVARRLNLNANKTRDLVRMFVPEAHQKVYFAALTKIVGLAKSVGIVPAGRPEIGLVKDTDDAWQQLFDKHDIEIDEQLATEAQLFEYARTILSRSIELASTTEIDFDDQIYMPVISRARFWQNDFLFVDEAQDLNAIQRAMCKLALKPGGRLIAVGDPAQAIYGFRGADSNSIENIKAEFAAIELPLTVSYRCPKAVVAEAQAYVSHIQAAPTAPEGFVGDLGLDWKVTQFAQTDAVVCRNTAPLIELAFNAIRNNVPVRVLGREIGAGLVTLINKMKANGINALEEKLSKYQARETAKYMIKGQEQKADALADKIDTIATVIENLTENERTIPALLAKIEGLFTDNDKGLLTLCTIHKSKGLEWQKVYFLNSHLLPSPYARQDWQLKQEYNLIYVAVTRSKDQLIYIETPKKKKF